MESKSFTSDEIKKQVPSWNLKNEGIEKEFKFLDFKKAFEFMNEVAVICEVMHHHPNWTNNYNILKIVLFTHDKSAITELDIELAQKIDLLFESK